jgi:hypothetical protein
MRTQNCENNTYIHRQTHVQEVTATLSGNTFFTTSYNAEQNPLESRVTQEVSTGKLSLSHLSWHDRYLAVNWYEST